MAEVKNAFIKSKMNQDLDGRLLPSGEYREGINIQVSKSEGPDVGALENVRGNELVVNFRNLTSAQNIDVIGEHTDVSNNTVYVFLTDYTDPNPVPNQTYNTIANNYIFSYNISTKVSVQLATGNWLNFSKKYPIYGINVLENLLFWTDNRNQPRKLNISQATNIAASTSTTGFFISNYYTLEEQISVAKLYPYQCINLYRSNGQTPPVYSTSMLDVVSQYLPNGGTGTADATGPGTTINILTSSIQGQITVGATISSTSITNSPTVVSKTLSGNFTSIVVSSSIEWVNDQLITFNANPDYDASYPGDPDYLRNKFVRFSYRYKFADGEYSPYAPFTQAAFIPQQDGYFLTSGIPGTTTDEDDTFRSTVVQFMQNKVNKVILNIPLPSTNISTDYKIQEIDILYKESDSLAVTVLDTILNSALPNNANFIDYKYESRKPFRTLPESQLIRVYDKVPVRAFGQEISGNRVIYSNFQNKHTPPSKLNYNVGAFSKSAPFTLNATNPTTNATSIKEYPMHTLKQNRNYQVGIVLSDKFGRSSSVILSSVNQGDVLDVLGNGSFGGATYFHPYKDFLKLNTDSGKISTWAGDSLKVLFNEPGIPSNVNRNDLPGYPGLYNGDASEADYNPLGWYSYKIVVKQFEQEYYNVYLPGILNGYPGGTIPSGDVSGSTGFITLINDNINKVPRDLSEVGPEQKQYRSSVQLYGRVTPDADATIPTFNKQFYPGVISNTVNTIAEQDFVLGTISEYTDIYQTKSNPYLGRITQTSGNAIGSLPSTSTYPFFLGVYETAPVESRVNIFWETSTTGLISDLNAAISSGETVLTGFGDMFTYSGKESDAPGTYVTDPFAPQVSNIPSNPPVLIDSTMTLTSVVQGISPNSSELDLSKTNAKFILQKFNKNTPLPSGFPSSSFNGSTLPYDSYALRTASANLPAPLDGFSNQYFYFGDAEAIATNQMNYQFTFSVVNYENTPLYTTGTLANVPPIITNCSIVRQAESIQPDGLVYTFKGTNGLPNGSLDQIESLTWTLDKTLSASNYFMKDSTSGEVYTTDEVSGILDVSVILTDAGGDTDTCSLDGNADKIPLNKGFGSKINEKIKITSTSTSSTTVVWAGNATNSLPGTSSTVYNTAPYTNIAFGVSELPDSTATSPANYITTKTNTLNGQGTFGNRVINALGSSSLTDQSLGGLTEGTAFITVSIALRQNNEALNASEISQETYFGSPVQLQYRKNPGDNWGDAYDIEGKLILFGKENKNIISEMYTGVVNQTEDFPQQGVISNIGPTSFGTNASVNPALQSPPITKSIIFGDVMEGQLSIPESTQSPELVVISTQTFAIGTSQTYGPEFDKLGDYRLIVRYPYATSTTNSMSPVVLGYSNGLSKGFPDIVNGPDSGDKITLYNDRTIQIEGNIKAGDIVTGVDITGNPSVTNVEIAADLKTVIITINSSQNWGANPMEFTSAAGASFPDGVWAGGQRNDGIMDVNISWGDFYYPKDYSVQLNGARAPIPSSFKYNITKLGDANAGDSGFEGPTEPVWAREWHSKYVTQFYTDEGLIPGSEFIPPTSTIGGNIFNPDLAWFNYSTVSENTINSEFGTDNSNSGYTESFTFPNTQFSNGKTEFWSNIDGFNNINRKWSAYLQANGIKPPNPLTTIGSTAQPFLFVAKPSNVP